MSDHAVMTRPGANAIVYVREADPELLPEHLKGASGRVYAVHDESGNPLAIAPDRAQAFALARRNDLTPLSVH
jgi:hypothetical protein